MTRNRHKYSPMRPHSGLAQRLPGEYPRSVNTALERYLYLVESSTPHFSPAEWHLIEDACTGWLLEEPSPDLLLVLARRVEEAVSTRQAHQAWGIPNPQALIERLQHLTPVEAVAVVHQIEHGRGDANRES